MKNFSEKIGREHDKVQLKNKWDQLKKDWKLWKDLKRGSTGLGWDPRRKTIDAPDEWWKEKLEVVPNAKKFRYCGINPELEHKLDSMFMGVVATGVHAWTPNQGIDHENIHGDTEKLDTTTDSFEDPSQSFDSISECSQFKRPSSTTSTGSRKKKLDLEWNVVRMQDCIGAIDGTHVDARVSTAEKKKLIMVGSCGTLSNVQLLKETVRDCISGLTQLKVFIKEHCNVHAGVL
ncbi:hypothetical protein KFK09_011777 [Dendrobium nobile]|uniref:Myb/SANT-like domain-containing protein n=1 Tax=Dendrobium nobile TaxID=94219 RepID=A0A8T3BFH0_DENNO|nr:hypothetical protein KFK09_011777 [Dendrobium nobile]